MDSARFQGMIVEFALNLLQRGLKKGHVNSKAPEIISMLDPLLPHLVLAMSSRQSGVVELALRVMSQLVQAPLPGRPLSQQFLSVCSCCKLSYRLVRQSPDDCSQSLALYTWAAEEMILQISNKSRVRGTNFATRLQPYDMPLNTERTQGFHVFSCFVSLC